MHNERLPDDHPIFSACRNGDVQTVEKFLDQGISVHADSPRNPTLMSCATGEGQLEVVKLLVARGIDVKKPLPGVGARAPIFLALGYNRHELVDYFFSVGTPYDISDDYGVQPLMCASGAGNLDLINRIIDGGVDVNVATHRGMTPLMFAARANQIPALEALFEAGAKIDQPDTERKTALIHTSQLGKYESTLWLLKHGSDVLAEDDQHKSALDWAKANGHNKIVEAFQQHISGVGLWGRSPQ